MKPSSYRYQVIFREEPEGGYTVLVPALPGCITWGRTLNEARDMAQDAITCYLTSLAKHGEDVPTDANMDSFLGTVEINPSSINLRA